MAGGGRGAPAPPPALPAPPAGQGDTLPVAAARGQRAGSPGFGAGRQWGRGGERLSAFQTCPWKRSGPSRLRCKWPQTKSWGASPPNPLTVRRQPVRGVETPDPGTLPAGGSRRGAACTRCTPSPPCTPLPGCPSHVSSARGACPSLPRIPLPARPPVPNPYLHCRLGGSRGAGRGLPRGDGVRDAAALSGPKPGCARQG